MTLNHEEADIQDRLIARLVHCPTCFGDPQCEVEYIETHISHLLLAGDRVYKIKKPLDLGFLDFSTLEKRRQCCEEELRLNSRLAPDLYLGWWALEALWTRRESMRMRGSSSMP
ncbi:MAG: hypothetical protein ABW159_06425 [Candidatus Thiodiazotropha sp.]